MSKTKNKPNTKPRVKPGRKTKLSIPTIRKQIYIPVEDNNFLVNYSAGHGLFCAEVIRQAVAEYIKKLKHG